MSVVLLVDDRLRGQRLALKRMQHRAASDLRRLKREYRAIERVVHPNIVSVYELGIDAEGPYFLMEAVDGVDLRHYCRGALAEPSRYATAASHEVSGVVTRGADAAQCSTGALQRAAERGRNAATVTFDPHTNGQRAVGAGAHAPPLAEAGLQQLFATLPQLIAALECLHEAGLVHRDLKPGNVLVSGDGVLKLLDFGILGETGAAPLGAPQGTAAYMAPEQIRGEPPAPEHDLYALGVMLFEVVTGHLPFAGTDRRDLLLQHLYAEPIAAHVLAPLCPEWLAAAIAGLLDKSAARRPRLRELRALCAAHAPSAAAAPYAPTATALVERDDEQRALLDLLDDANPGRLRFAAIYGETGLGKSALLEWTRGAARRRQLTVLESRVRFSERVPFNAIDGLVDDLAALLERFPELCADDDGRRLRDKASAAFAVLARGSGRRSEPALEPREGRGPSDPREVFDALIALLQRCTQITGRLVLLCDDLQWADADSVSFLLRLIAADLPGVLLIAAVRDDTHTEAFARLWSRAAPQVRIDLPRLSARALVRIIAGVAADAGQPIAERVARKAALGCDGRPLLAVVSGRVAARTEVGAEQPIAWLLDRYAMRGGQERRLLALLAVIDGDTALAQLARLSAMTPGEIDELLSPLVRERLMRVAGSFGAQRAYDFSHDLVRRQLLAVLQESEIRDAHADVAEDLRASGARAAERVRHLLGAQRWHEAAEIAAIAAREAEGADAFGLAAELYEVAIAHSASGTAALRAARAVALERSGRYLDSAVEWRRLAEQQRGEARIDALLQQAKALLATDHIAEGRRALELAQRERQERTLVPLPLANAAAVTRFLLGPWALPGRARLNGDVRSVPTDERDVFLGTMIGFFDPIAGVRHMLRARGMYRARGNRTQSAEVDYVLAFLALFGERLRERTGLADRYARSARAALGGQTLPEHGRPYALDLMVQGVRAMHVGAWSTASDALEAAIAFYETIGRKGSFEHLFCCINRMTVERYTQNLAELPGQLDAIERVIDEGQDSALRSELGYGRARCAFLRGDMAEALRLAQQTRDRWPQDEPSYQAYLSQLHTLTPQIYLSDGVEARRELQHMLRVHARFMPMRSMDGIDLISHCAFFEVAALARGVPGASAPKVLRLAKLAERCCPIERNLALRSAAYAYDALGEPEHALAQLERAEGIAQRDGQAIDTAIARFQRGLRLGGDEGRALMQGAELAVVQAGSRPLLLHEDPARR